MPLPQDLLNGTGCFTCLGISIGDALDLALWQSISSSISGGDITILTELGIDLLDETGVALLIE